MSAGLLLTFGLHEFLEGGLGLPELVCFCFDARVVCVLGDFEAVALISADDSFRGFALRAGFDVFIVTMVEQVHVFEVWPLREGRQLLE